MAEKWYNSTPEDCAERLSVDLSQGLDRKAVRARLSKYGKNDVFVTPGASFISCIRAAGADISSYLLIALAIIARIFHQNVSAVVIVVLIVVNFLLTLLIYAKSQHILRNMSGYAEPMSMVLREGKLMAADQALLVPGDVVFVRAGDVIPADARVVAARDLTVTDEPFDTPSPTSVKTPDMVYGVNVPPCAQKYMLFATSTVTGGSAKILLCACGGATYAALNGKRKEIVQHNDLNVLKRLKKTCKIWSLVMLVMVFLITAADLALGLESRGLYNIFITGASLWCAAMTEFYVLFAYFIIGCGLFGTVKKNGPVNSGAVIKNISTLEEIKGIDTFIVPKMGGFYSDYASVERIYASDTLHRVNEKNLYNYCSRTIKFALLASGYAADPSVFEDTASEASALVVCAERMGIDRSVLMADYPLLYSSRFFEDTTIDCAIVAGTDTYIAIMRGEAVPLLEKCEFYLDGNEVKELDDRERRHINAALKTIDEEGYRAVAVVTKTTDMTDFSGISSSGWTLEGLVGMCEPALYGAEENIRDCLENGIDVIVFADDERDPSRVYFKRIGLITDDSQIISADEFDRLDDDQRRDALTRYRMYEGLSCDQKRELVALLRDEGRTIGVLGRHLEDVALLSEADVGFAVGVTLSDRSESYELDKYLVQRIEKKNYSGSEALKYGSDVLVSPPGRKRGGFNAMIRSRHTAKNIYQNLMRMVKYLFTSQIARLVVVIYSVVVHNFWQQYKGTEFLQPAQILFLGLIVDFVVVVSIAFQRAPDDILSERENTEERLEGNFMANFFRTLAFGLIWGVAAFTVPMIMSLAGADLSGDALTSLVFVSFILTELVVASEIVTEKSLFNFKGRRINRPLILAWIAAIIFIALCFIIKPLGVRFGVTVPVIPEILCTVIVPAVMLGLYELYKYFKNKNIK